MRACRARLTDSWRRLAISLSMLHARRVKRSVGVVARLSQWHTGLCEPIEAGNRIGCGISGRGPAVERPRRGVSIGLSPGGWVPESDALCVRRNGWKSTNMGIGGSTAVMRFCSGGKVVHAAVETSSAASELKFAGTDVLEAYDSLVAAGGVVRDDKQRELAKILSHYLSAEGGPACTTKPGILDRFLPWKKPAAVKGGRKGGGVYVYGSVGCGKSFLMDLFYSCSTEEKKCRIHFHEFMLDVHARMHRERLHGRNTRSDHDVATLDSFRSKRNSGFAGGDDILGRVAMQMAEEYSLLCFDEFQVKGGLACFI